MQDDRLAASIARRMMAGLAVLAVLGAGGRAWAQDTLLNVSYDPTRELYKELDQVFAPIWQARSGRMLVARTSNGGSAAQARAVLEGLPADVVTLAVASDVDRLAEKGLVARDWATRFPDHAVPYTSVAVLMVRKGNPHHIRDWGDLARDGVSVVTPNPKTSGGARWNYLAALGWALRQKGADAASAQAFLRRMFANVAVLDTGARGATQSFVERGIGDVLVTAENEAQMALREFGGAGFELIYPSVTILEEAPVAVVDATVDKRGDRALAEAYLGYLWSKPGQELLARHHFRPRDPAVLAAHAAEFPHVATFDVASFGGWARAQAEQFADGGVFDRISAGSH